MHPIYFPYTFVSNNTAKQLRACFSQIIVYQVMEKPSQADIPGIEFKTPLPGNENEIEKTLEEYKSWARLHQGRALSFFKTQMTKIPFYSETSISQIRADIKKRTQQSDLNTSEPGLVNPETIFKARLFLAIAHEHDIEHARVSKDLADLDKIEKKMFKELKGKNENSGEDPFFSETGKQNQTAQIYSDDNLPDDNLIDQRIHAWSRLALNDSSQSGILVTNHAAVLDFLSQQGLLDEYPLADINGIPIEEEKNSKMLSWQQETLDFFNQLATTPNLPENPVCPNPPNIHSKIKAKISVYVSRNLCPNDFFKKLAMPEQIQKSSDPDSPFRHTLICLITPFSP